MGLSFGAVSSFLSLSFMLYFAGHCLAFSEDLAAPAIPGKWAAANSERILSCMNCTGVAVRYDCIVLVQPPPSPGKWAAANPAKPMSLINNSVSMEMEANWPSSQNEGQNEAD